MMAVYAFSLVVIFFTLPSNFLRNSLLHKNKRLLISEQVFVNLLENWYKMRKIMA